MSGSSLSDGLSLPYLIDALAQLEEATARRAREENEAEMEFERDARSAGRPPDSYSESSRWRTERETWYRAIAPLRHLTSALLERELAQLAREPGNGDVPSAGELLRVLVAAARQRAGGTVDADTLSGL